MMRNAIGQYSRKTERELLGYFASETGGLCQ